MSISHSSDSDDSIRENVATVKRYLHSTIGKGQVADVLLWRNTRLSASLLLGFTAMWFLFEVYEYNLISLLCHIAILAMLILYITYTIAKFTQCGEDLTQFFLTMTSLWMISVIGSYFSSLNLIYLCLICIGTLPALYERYEHEVDYLASKGIRDMKNTLKQFEFNVLSKIPREQVNGNKWK
ncbi:Reticulon [Cynara cardunculus var. scolymus]|uniref:Reticulon-like protein n=1 Tax=Cynara cardunculus var. scolymus TaxID=59895 RepID=A0A103YA89_CYNCS|nr:Reticulon [Cynara cardunculus var. scolymus]